MNRFLKYWRLTGRGEAFHAHVIAYADDFVILSRGFAAEALAWTEAVTRIATAQAGAAACEALHYRSYRPAGAGATAIGREVDEPGGKR